MSKREKRKSGKLHSQRNTGGQFPVWPRREFLKPLLPPSSCVFPRPLKKSSSPSSLHVEARLPCFLSAAPRWRSRHRQRRRPICLPAATAAFIKLTVGSRKGFQVSNREKIVNISPRCPACSPSSLPQAPLLLSLSTFCFLLLQVPELSSHLIKRRRPSSLICPQGLNLGLPVKLCPD